MIGFLRNIFNRSTEVHSESVESLPPTVTGSQKSLETEQHRWLVPQLQIIHPFDLSEYLELYVIDSLAFTLVQADTNLTVSEFEYQSKSDSVNDYLRDFHRRLDMERTAWELYRDVSLFGFAGFEIIGNAGNLDASTEILALRRIDPRYLFIQKNRYGRIERFYQRPLNATYAVALQAPYGVPLQPESIIYVHSLSPLTSYGQSLLQPLKARLEQLNELVGATVQAHIDHANAVHWLQYRSDSELEEVATEIDAQVTAMNKATDDIDETGTRWMLSGGTGEYNHKILAADQLPDAAPLIDRLTADIIRSAGFHPSILGMGETAKTGETSRYSVNSIITRQRNLMAQIHAKLYSILPFIESECPASSADEMIVTMREPDEQTAKEMLEAETIRVNNVGLKLRMGLISEDKAAMELGYEEFADKEQLDQWKNTNSGEVNPNDPNDTQQIRKSIDTLGKGKEPSNNPSGQRK